MPPKKSKKNNKPPNLTKKATIKALLDASTPWGEIQKALGVSPNTISAVKKEFQSNKELVDYYKDNKADLLAQKQVQILTGISKFDLATASGLDKAKMYGIFFDKERLQRGESTENIAVQVDMIRHFQKKRWKEIA